MPLTREQSNTTEGILQYVFDGCIDGTVVNFPILKGYAGTGKTFTISAIVQTLIQRGYHIAVTAPTHKAVKVLKRSGLDVPQVQPQDDWLNHTGVVEFGTIHSLLGLKPQIQKDGTRKYLPDTFSLRNGNKMDKYNVLIVDESSMLNVDLFNQIMEYIKKRRLNPEMYDLQLMFVGDPLQIPPVKELNSMVFSDAITDNFEVAVYELTQIVRQAEDNPILDFATDIRTHITEHNRIYDFSNADKGDTGIQLITESTVQQLYKDLFCSEAFEQDSDYAKVLCWDNITVNAVNSRIRCLRLGLANPPNIVEGDRLIADAPIIISGASGMDIIAFHTSDEFSVERVTIVSQTYDYQIVDRVKDLSLKRTQHSMLLKLYEAIVVGKTVDGEDVTHTIHIVHDDSLTEFNAAVAAMRKAASKHQDRTQWKQYHGLLEAFARVKYNYALTCHKSQGSTYTYTIMMDTNIKRNPSVEERNRIRYVAATRAKQKLYIL